MDRWAPGSGKTTVAKRRARRHGLRLYGADTQTWAHRDRALAASNAAAHRWESLTPAERWECSTPAELVAMSLHRERGQMVVDDLGALPDSPLVVAEGSTLPAWAVSCGIAERSHAVWLIPTKEFQRAQLAARATPAGHARLYLLLGEVIAREAEEHRAPTLVVDGSSGIADTADAIERLFADALATGPLAHTLDERRALLRETNEMIAAQVRGYHARPWAHGDPEGVVRDFVCECGDRACEADVRLSMGELTAGPALARGHDQP